MSPPNRTRNDSDETNVKMARSHFVKFLCEQRRSAQNCAGIDVL